jgi:CheY-like chemotaxis protein
LKQILINLLSNAVKFTPAGGEIGMNVYEDPSTHSMNFTIWDRGIGIKQESFPNLFKPFVQIDSSLSREFAGTGLGLTLVKSLTEMHGGCVTVESTPSKGSSFNVCLPIKDFRNSEIGIDSKEIDKQKENEHSEHSQDVSQNTKLKEKALVLIVEDNEINIEMLENYLKMLKYRILIARTGEEAILLAHEKFPDIVLMDIQMPGMDGIETAKMLRKSCDQLVANVPIIALTALAMPGDRQKCFDSGMNEYFKKPLSLKELVVKIEELTSINARK